MDQQRPNRKTDSCSHIFHVLETISQIAQKRVIEVFQHPPFTNNVSDTLGSNNWPGVETSRISIINILETDLVPLGKNRRTKRAYQGSYSPSSFRIYLRANVRPESFLSTMRTFPNAPFPTTRRRRKWLRLTIQKKRSAQKQKSSTVINKGSPLVCRVNQDQIGSRSSPLQKRNKKK